MDPADPTELADPMDPSVESAEKSEPFYLSMIRRLVPDGSGGFIIQAEAGKNTAEQSGSIGDELSPDLAGFSSIQDIQRPPAPLAEDFQWFVVDERLQLVRGLTADDNPRIVSIAGGILWPDTCATDSSNCQPTFGRPVSIQKVTQDTESEYWILDAESGRIRAYDRSDPSGDYSVENALGYPGFSYSSCYGNGCPPSTLNSQLSNFTPP